MASFSVVSNIASNNAQANLYGTQVGLQKALTRLSSGFRINVSGDDAAGLAVANTYRNDTTVINQGIRNANDGLSVLQVKDGALANVSTLLDRLSTLATQAASAGTSGVSYSTLQDESNAIVVEIKRELNVAKLTSPQAFGAFISNDGSYTDTTYTANAPVTQTLSGGLKDATNAAALIGAATQFDATVGGRNVHADFAGGDSDTVKKDKVIAAFNTAFAQPGESTAFDNADTYTVVSTTANTSTKNAGEVTGMLKAIDLGAVPGGGAAPNTTYLDIMKADGTFVDLDTIQHAETAVAKIQTALGRIGDIQGTIGTLQNKLQFAVSLAQSQQVNKKAAESRIRDANVAEESANMTRYNILTQSGIAALAQANQSTSAVLSLLK